MADKGIPVSEATTGTLDKIDMKQATNANSETVFQQRIVIAADETPAIANPLPVQGSDGTNAQAFKAGSTEAALTDVAAVVTLRPSENHVGEVGGKSSIVKVPLTVTAGAYTAGMSVGGLVDLGAILRKSGGTGVLQSLLVSDHANQKAPFTILLFDSASVSTFTDHTAAPTLTATDLTHLIRAVNVAASDYTTVGSSAVADLSPGGRVVAGNASQHLWMAVVTSGTPTYAATSDVAINLGFLLD